MSTRSFNWTLLLSKVSRPSAGTLLKHCFDTARDISNTSTYTICVKCERYIGWIPKVNIFFGETKFKQICSLKLCWKKTSFVLRPLEFKTLLFDSSESYFFLLKRLQTTARDPTSTLGQELFYFLMYQKVKKNTKYRLNLLRKLTNNQLEAKNCQLNSEFRQFFVKWEKFFFVFCALHFFCVKLLHQNQMYSNEKKKLCKMLIFFEEWMMIIIDYLTKSMFRNSFSVWQREKGIFERFSESFGFEQFTA